MSSRLRMLVLASFFTVAASSPAQEGTVEGLIEKLQVKKKSQQIEALQQLGKRGTAAKGAVEAIGRLLRETDEADVVVEAASTLAKIGPAGVPELVPLFKDAREAHARAVAMALARMGPAAAKATPNLIAALKDHDPIVRAYAAQALAEIGAFPDEVTFALFSLIVDPEPQVRQQAGLALVRAGKKAVPGLTRIVREAKGTARVEASHLLAHIGPDASAALSDLQVALQEPTPELRAASAKAIGSMKGRAKEALPLLLTGLAKEQSYPVQQDIFQALLMIGEQDAPGFLEEIRRVNQEGNWAAPYVLARFGPRGVDAVRPLIKSLKDADAGMRTAAAMALGQVGVEAAEAIPHLQMLMKDEAPQVRFAAAQALTKVDVRQQPRTQQQFLQALEQSEKSMEMMELQLRKKLAGMAFAPRTPVDLRLFQDPTIQQPLRQLMDYNLSVNASMMNSRHLDKVTQAQLRALSRQTDQFVQTMGPEGIPTLVYGINQAAAFQLGFC